jgi:hypothetical protein
MSKYSHQQYIKLLSSYLQSWLESHITLFGVFELGYNFYHIDKNQYLFVSTNASWRDQFLDLGLDQDVIKLLQQDIFTLSNQSPIKQCYNEYHDVNSCKTLFVFRNVAGFELFEVTTQSELSYLEQSAIKRSLMNLTYDLKLFIKNKISPSIYSEINGLDRVKVQHAKQLTKVNTPYNYEWACFQGELVLTTKEQLFIEYLMVHLTQKEIASQHNCSVKMVRKKLVNIKRKLGNASMKTSTMMFELKKRGVLSMFSQFLS